MSGPALVTAFVRAALLTSALAAALWLVGALPSGREGYIAAGCAAAVGASAAALLLHGRFLDARAMRSMGSNARLLAVRLQSLLAAGLMLKLAVVTVGVLWLRAQNVKFELIAAFAVAFAAASLVCQVTAAGTLVRALGRPKVSADRPAGGS